MTEILLKSMQTVKLLFIKGDLDSAIQYTCDGDCHCVRGDNVISCNEENFRPWTLLKQCVSCYLLCDMPNNLRAAYVIQNT